MGEAVWEWRWDETKFLQILLLNGMGSDAFQFFTIEVEYGQGTIRRCCI
jgi:hypothetical protein